MKRGNRGQFYLITSLLVFIIITAAVASIYSSIRGFEIERSEKAYIVASTVNADLKKACGFALAYYGSILQVTGNTTYARELITTYFSDSLTYISAKNPAFGVGVSLQSLNFNVTWFRHTSFSELSAETNYTLSLCDWGPINYKAMNSLTVEIIQVNNTTATLRISKDDGELVILHMNNFKFAFFKDSAWQFISPSVEPTVYADGTYVISLPQGMDPDNFFVVVEDGRGIVVVAANRESYVYNFSWDSRWVGESSSLMVELLQSGEMRVLGENLQFSTTAEPLLPLPVKALHLNLTVNGLSQEVPFQIEDWEHDGMVPLGLASNSSLISCKTMLVFLVNSNVSQATLWWDGSDAAVQTPCAYTNLYFTGDNPSSGTLTNGRLSLNYLSSNWLTSTVGTVQAKAGLMRINSQVAFYGSDPTVIIHHGIIRDIIQQEAEWSGGITTLLYVDGFSATWSQWSKIGGPPYLQDTDADCIRCSLNNSQIGWFTFQNSPISVSGMQVRIGFETYCSGGDDYFEFVINDGTTNYGPYSITPSSSYSWKYYDVSSILNTASKINNAKIYVTYKEVGGSASDVCIRRCMLSSATVTCPDVYSQIVITLPANCTYYTYQLRLIFTSTAQPRGVFELCPLILSPPAGTFQTENGMASGNPIISTLQGVFYNASNVWQHHFSQSINTGRGAGVMFTNADNWNLYYFDTNAIKTGALSVSSASGIKFSPVSMASVSFQTALDIAWYGAVATFDGDTPIYDASGKGLWLIAEYPPAVELLSP
jgi:hypothetical protein